MKVLSVNEIKRIFGFDPRKDVAYPKEYWPVDENGFMGEDFEEIIDFARENGLEILDEDGGEVFTVVMTKSPREEILLLSKINTM